MSRGRRIPHLIQGAIQAGLTGARALVTALPGEACLRVIPALLLLLTFLLLTLVLATEPVQAQVQLEAGDLDSRVAERIEITRDRYGSPAQHRRCQSNGGEDEIVVCAPDRGEDQRVPSTADSDPASREARRELNNGVPRAPQLDRGSCRGQAGCMVGGWAPPPVYMIDVKAIPEAPEGSEADLIAKGEKPAH